MCLDQFGTVHVPLPSRSEQPFALAAQVAEVAAAGTLGEDRAGQPAELPAERRLHDRQLRRDEEEQQHGRVALEREPEVLAEVVGDEVEVARPRAGAFRLRSLHPVLERVQLAALPTGELQSEPVLGRLDEDRHLVPVVLAAVVQAVHRRADRRAEDGAARNELAQIHAAHLLSGLSSAGRPAARPSQSAPRAKSETSCGVAVSKPTTSSMPGSFGSAMEKPFETMPTTTRRASMPDARR